MCRGLLWMATWGPFQLYYSDSTHPSAHPIKIQQSLSLSLTHTQTHTFSGGVSSVSLTFYKAASNPSHSAHGQRHPVILRCFQKGSPWPLKKRFQDNPTL